MVTKQFKYVLVALLAIMPMKVCPGTWDTVCDFSKGISAVDQAASMSGYALPAILGGTIGGPLATVAAVYNTASFAKFIGNVGYSAYSRARYGHWHFNMPECSNSYVGSATNALADLSLVELGVDLSSWLARVSYACLPKSIKNKCQKAYTTCANYTPQCVKTIGSNILAKKNLLKALAITTYVGYSVHSDICTASLFAYRSSLADKLFAYQNNVI